MGGRDLSPISHSSLQVFSGHPRGNITETWGYEQAGACAALLLRALIVLLEIPPATATRVTYRQTRS